MVVVMVGVGWWLGWWTVDDYRDSGRWIVAEWWAVDGGRDGGQWIMVGMVGCGWWQAEGGGRPVQR